MTSTDLHIVIPAGGIGSRLWPLSRADRPKFFHALTGGGRSLLQATLDRLSRVGSVNNTYVVTGIAHAAGIAEQLPEVPQDNILAELSPRDSCAAIALAAAVIEHRSPGAIMGSFAADHLIQDVDLFAKTIQESLAGARDGYLMAIGIAPTEPHTGYGYLQCGAAFPDSAIRHVLKFKEKPSLEAAQRYLASGDYLWNASMFVWRTDVFLGELLSHRPDIHEPITAIAAAWDTPQRDKVVAELWPTLPKIAIDYAVMEPAAAMGKVATIPGNFGWNDIGDFDTLGELFAGVAGNTVIPDVNANPETAHRSVVNIDSTGLVVVPRSDRLITTIGLEDLVIVDTPDAVLICRRDRAQDIKKLTETLRAQGHTDQL